MINFRRAGRIKEILQGIGMLAAVVGSYLFFWVVVYGSLSDNPWLAIPSRIFKGAYGITVLMLAALLVLFALWVIWRIASRGLKYFDDK